MKQRSIPFSAQMARALLSGTKTQTRRVLKPQPPAEARSAGVIHSTTNDNGLWWWLDDVDLMNAGTVGEQFRCPYGVPGDQLWVREAWRTLSIYNDRPPRDVPVRSLVSFDADGEQRQTYGRYRHARFMPRWASRTLLEITDVRVQRLWDISGDDAIEEGLDPADLGDAREEAAMNVANYCELWESINGAGSWDANPWVWVVEFKRG